METRQQNMIRALREAGYTYRAIATRVGVSEPALHRWRNGGGSRDPKAFTRLCQMFEAMCKETGVKHD